MDHSSMEAMMRGAFAPKKKRSDKTKEAKNRFEIALERQIDSYVDAMELEDDPSHKELLPQALRREKIKAELKAAAKMEELSQLLESAVELLLSEGASYLSEEAYERLCSDFSDAFNRIASISLDRPEDLDVPALIQMSSQSLDAIATIATDKYAKERYFDCLSLFSLLSIINPTYAEYWFRMAMAAQKSGNLDLALRGYAAAAQIDPTHIGARLFAAECYAGRTLFAEAQAEYEAAKEIARTHQVDAMWLELLPLTEHLIKP
ncbi:MAG: hypothetical protein JSR46_06505 [Verrucomicrobia bacterium]|nr:hypothetical protein [Verrucomicrobiota bacterium]